MIFSGYHLGIYLLNSTIEGFLIDREEVVKNGGLTVNEISLTASTFSNTRNSTFIIEAPIKDNKEIKKFFAKQTNSWEFNQISSINNEKNIYDLLIQFGLHDMIGEFLTFDKVFNILIFNYVETEDEFTQQDQPINFDLLFPLANVFNHFHKIDIQTIKSVNKLDLFGFRKPLLFSLKARDITDLVSTITEKRQIEILKLLQEEDFKLLKKIDEIGWNATNLIHFDFKFAHILLEKGCKKLRLIDWEMADIGDPYWDLACVWYEIICSLLEDDSVDAIFDDSKVPFQNFLAKYINVIDSQKISGFLGILILQNKYYGLFPDYKIGILNTNAWTAKAVDLIYNGQNFSLQQSNSSAIITLNITQPANNSQVVNAQSNIRATNNTDNDLKDLLAKIKYDFKNDDTETLDAFIYRWFFGGFEPKLVAKKAKIANSTLIIAESTRVGKEIQWTDTWWRVDGVTRNQTAIIRKASEKRLAAAGDYIFSSSGRKNYDQAIEKSNNARLKLYYPKFSLRGNDAKPDSNDLWVFSRLKIRQDYPNWVRFYFHLKKPSEGVNFMIQEMTKRLNARRIPFEIKFRNNFSSYYRTDVAILFIHRQHFFAAIDSIAVVYNLLKKEGCLGKETPKFTKYLAKGLAFGENPPVLTESFGNYRAKIIAEILEKNWKNQNSWLSIVKQELQKKGFNTFELYRNPFPKDGEYKFRYDEIHKKIKKPPKLGVDIDNAIELSPSQRFLKAAKIIAFIICREAIWYGDKCTWLSFKIEEDKNEEKKFFFTTLSNQEKLGIALFLAGMAWFCPDEGIFKNTLLGTLNLKDTGKDIEKIYNDLHKKYPSKLHSVTNIPPNSTSVTSLYNNDFRRKLYTSNLLGDRIIEDFLDLNIPFPNAYVTSWGDELGGEFNPTLSEGLAALGYFFLGLSDKNKRIKDIISEKIKPIDTAYFTQNQSIFIRNSR